MISEELIKEADILHAQIEKGVIVLPAIASFLSKISSPTNNKRKIKKQSEQERIDNLIIKMNSRKKPVRKTV